MIVPPRCHHLAPPLPKTSRAFRLTRGRAWSTDTTSQNLLMPGGRLGLRPLHPPTAGIAVPEGSPMRCPRCEADNPEGMRFCIECAAPLTRRCPHCGLANPPQAKFCGQCATPLTEQPPAPQPQAPLRYTPRHLAEKILTSKTALEGERKQVTVLFADLKGSKELLADRDPEEARQLLDP